jgi:hypothetical protein
MYIVGIILLMYPVASSRTRVPSLGWHVQHPLTC